MAKYSITPITPNKTLLIEQYCGSNGTPSRTLLTITDEMTEEQIEKMIGEVIDLNIGSACIYELVEVRRKLTVKAERQR